MPDTSKAAESYERKKTYKGKSYSGMRVGGVHRWDYPDGRWNERKVDQKMWKFAFASHKYRKRRAPEGSGAGVGSGFHWLIVADQWVEKTDANTYATIMEGEKHLLGFRKPDWDRWNTEFRNQKSARQKTIMILREILERLEADEDAGSIEEPWDHPNFVEVGIVPDAMDVIEDIAPEEVLLGAE
jgi:hypothetical protein